MIFKTKEEAELYIHHDIMGNLWFCPLIKTICNINCINFVKPLAFINDDAYEVKPAACNNPLIIGEIEICTGQHAVAIENVP